MDETIRIPAVRPEIRQISIPAPVPPVQQPAAQPAAGQPSGHPAGRRRHRAPAEPEESTQSLTPVLDLLRRYAPVALDASYLAALSKVPVAEVRAALNDLADSGQVRLMSRDRARVTSGPLR